MEKWSHSHRLWNADAAGTATSDVPTRADIGSEYKWKLEDMVASDEVWEEQAKQVLRDAEQLAGFQGRLTSSAEVLAEGLQVHDTVVETLSRLAIYAHMRRDEDNSNGTYQALADRSMALEVQVDSQRAFFVPEILAAPEDTLRQWIDTVDALHTYRFFLLELLRQKEHVLSAEQEQLLAQAGEMAGAPQQIFTMFNNADLRFPSVRDEHGEEVELTHGRYSRFMESRDRDVRKHAFIAYHNTYAKNRNTLAAMYGGSVRKDIFYARVRKYNSALEAALGEDNIPVSVYDNLISAVHDALPALHKYLSLRKRVLGVEDLHMYDLYTPLVSELDVKIPYAEAVETVKKAIAPLGDDYVRAATQGLSSGWVDVYETRGKTSGAYSWGSYPTHPYILLNHQDNLNDMFTLAHELGHAMHTYYSYKTQPFIYSGYTIFVAEVASTCNEALLTQYLLQNSDDTKMRAYLINHQLEGLRATLFRQTMFAEFEKLTHAHVEAGDALTPDWLCETYYNLVQTYFGAVCDVEPEVQIEWARIPHFYNAFYVYKYATGISASTALSQKILNDGAPAVEAYLSFLKGGSSDYSIDLLRRAGVDMASPEPVASALTQFSKMVDDLAELLASE